MNRGASGSAELRPAGEKGERTKNKGPSSHWILLVLFVSLLLDLLGFTVILPLIPSLLEYYGRGDQVC